MLRANIGKIWNDPVWSTVIGGIISAILVWVFQYLTNIDIRWIALLFGGLLFIVLVVIFRRFWWRWRQLILGLSVGVALTLLTPALIALSIRVLTPPLIRPPADEMPFRRDLHRFIQSNMGEVWQDWNSVVDSTLSEYNIAQAKDETPLSRIMHELYGEGIGLIYDKMDSIGKMPPEAMNIEDAQNAIISFLLRYQDALNDLRLFEQITRQKADAGALSKLAAASRRAAESLRDLESSQHANLLRQKIPSTEVESFFSFS